MSNKPRKWYEIYQQNTQAGDEEHDFFIALARHPQFSWRSVSALAKATDLTEKRIEEIINKYYKMGMVVRNPKNDEQWGYWENVGTKEEISSLNEKDQKDRIIKKMKEKD